MSQKALLKEQTRAALEKLRGGQNGNVSSQDIDGDENPLNSSTPGSVQQQDATLSAAGNSDQTTNAVAQNVAKARAGSADGPNEAKKRRYRHASYHKRDYSDSECDDRDDDNDMSDRSDVSRDEWGRVRRGRGTFLGL